MFDTFLSRLDRAQIEPFPRERLVEQIGHFAVDADDQRLPLPVSDEFRP